jgi:hypothetical protein
VKIKAISSCIYLTLIMMTAGCGGGDNGPEYDPNCPLCEPSDFEDHILHSCTIYYRWNGLFNSWTSCDNSWTPVADQPVFTSLEDCQVAKRILISQNGTYWDDSQPDRNRGYAWKLFCFNAD